MATCVENCRLCHESLPPKHRRTIFTETFGLTNQLIEVLGYIPRAEDGMSKYLCGFCFTKLNKLSKIEFDIAHRLEALKNEKFELLKMLGVRYVQIARPIVPSPRLSAEKQTCGTPCQETSKRPLFHSPTPRKVKKPLLFTPTKNRMILPKTQRKEVQDDTKPEAKKKKVSVSLFSPGKAKLLYRTSQSEKFKSRVIPPGSYQRIIKNLSKNTSMDRIGRVIYKSCLKESVNKSIFTEVKKECNLLCSRKDASILRNISSDNLATFSIDNLNAEIQKKPPFCMGYYTML